MIFKYDAEKEKNIFKQLCEHKAFTPQNEIYWQGDLDIQIEDKCPFLEETIRVIEKNWQDVEENFETQMSKFFEKELVIPEDTTCYLVRFSTFPYVIEKGWFCAPLFGMPTDKNRVIMHELCHFFTPKGIDKSLKEAIPVILNDHETFKMYHVDRGHQSDQEEMRLRKIIFEKYKEGKTYSQIVQEINSI